MREEGELIPEVRFEMLKAEGLQEHFDVDAIREMCPAEILDGLEGRRHRDDRGEDFANYIIPSLPRTADSLPIIFVGNTHIPCLSDKADEAGFRPLITTSLTRENFDRNRDFYEDPNAAGAYDGLGEVLSAVDFYKFNERTFTGANAIIFVGDSHGQSYELVLPSPGVLQNLGIREIQVFVEDERKGSIELDKLQRGFVGKRQLAAVLEQYREAGISLVINGIEDESYFMGSEAVGDYRMPSDYEAKLNTDFHLTQPSPARDITWQEVARDRGLSADHIADPRTWLEEQIAMYDRMGTQFSSTAQTYRKALRRLSEENS